MGEAVGFPMHTEPGLSLPPRRTFTPDHKQNHGITRHGMRTQEPSLHLRSLDVRPGRKTFPASLSELSKATEEPSKLSRATKQGVSTWVAG